MSKFFDTQFALSGDKIAIPDSTQPDGSVSYTEGYGFDYQRTYPTDPQSIPMGRQQFNQLMYDVTSACQQYQENGTPFFSTTYDGAPTYSYGKNALVLYDDASGSGIRIYRSKVNSNAALPSVLANWQLLDHLQNAIIYDNVSFASAVADGDAVYWDSSNTRFDQAIADGTIKQNIIGIADKTNGRVYALGLVSTLLSGLTAGAIYYLSSTTLGAMTLTLPFNNVVKIGTAQSTTSLFLAPQYLPYVNSQVPFAVELSANQSFPPSSFITVNFNAVEYDVGNFYNTSTFKFQPTIADYYTFSSTIHTSTFTSGNTMGAHLVKNSVQIFGSSGGFVSGTSDLTCNVSGSVFLNGSTDYVQVQANQTTAGTLFIINDTTRFQGNRIPA